MGTPSEPLEATVREELLAGATELFTRKGYASTTVREIVTAAGVTKPVLYYYFRNKEGIYLELIRQPFARFDALLDAFQRRGKEPPSKRILRLSDQVILPCPGKSGGGEADVFHLLWPASGGTLF